MAVTFTEVPAIEPGSPVTSTQLSKFADGINDRLRSGLADGAWRIFFYVFSLFRQIRNSDETGFLFPPQHEFFSAYQNILAADFRWPQVEPGEAEGVNVASIMGAFVFGSEAGNLYSEDLRVADEASGGVPLWNGLTVPTTPEEIWELGKRQRGAYDPFNGYIASPSFTAATEHYKISPYRTSPHGNSWGGYMPAPERGAACADPEFSNYLIFFTNLNDATVQSYSGTCPEDPTGVAGVSRTPRFYYVYLNDGTVDVLPIDEWIEGPYEGGAWIGKQSGEHIPRVLNKFASDFRGTPDQIANQESWLQHAFDTQRFLESQYHLAPARGSGDENFVGAVYPRFESTGSTTYAEGAAIGTEYSYHEDFVLASAFIKLTGFAGSSSIQFLSAGEVIKTVEVEADSSNEFSAIVTFDNPDTANPLSVRWGSDAQFTSVAGTVTVEANEILRYKPQLYDLYLCLRLASCNTNIVAGMDGSGLHEESSDIISDNYFANGCITNLHDAPGPAGVITEINTNAVFDAGRRLSQFVHIIPRENLIGYEVDSEGRSICYFRREGPGGQDLFEGIGPSREQIFTGSIEAEKRYVVRSGQVTYLGRNYFEDDVFTGVHPTTEFQGDGAVYEYDGIYSTAPREGFSNEWLMGQHFKVYNPDDASIWKPDAYSDFWTISERCHFYGTHTQDIQMHFDYGANLSIAPESPTGWRYVKNSNAFACPDTDPGTCEERRRDRYKSCRIYEPDPEIESATVLIEGGNEIIKLTFTGRLHAHEDAPASIDRDIGTWNIVDLNAESYRTTENGIREYLIWTNYGQNCTVGDSLNTAQQGNAALSANIFSDVYGACFPTFYFVKLFPKPYDDGNDSQQSHDTPLMADWWIQADLYLRAMCEGYVDGLTSANIGCETLVNALFDYTHESLFFEATGKKWPTTIATQETAYIEGDHIRDDAPQGFGQTPNTILSAQVYNQFASALNLLTKVRVMLPMKFQTRYTDDTLITPVTAQQPDGSTLTCATLGPVAGWWTGVPPDLTPATVGAWTDDTSLTAGQTAVIDMFSCDGANWNLTVTRTKGEWRWNYQDPDAENAIPESWRDMVLTHGRILAVRTRTNFQLRAQIADDLGDSQVCNATAGHWFDGVDYWKFVTTQTEDSETCEILEASGSFLGPTLGMQDLAIGRDAGGTACGIGVSTTEGLEPILGDDTTFIEIPLV